MYTRKSLGPRMEPLGTSALTGHYCKNFLSKTTQSRLLMRKDNTRPNIRPETP